jgi:hypothetical protein
MKNRMKDASLKDFLRINDRYLIGSPFKILNLKRVNRSHEVGNLTRVSSLLFSIEFIFRVWYHT